MCTWLANYIQLICCLNTLTHTHTHTHIYIYIYIYSTSQRRCAKYKEFRWLELAVCVSLRAKYLGKGLIRSVLLQFSLLHRLRTKSSLFFSTRSHLFSFLKYTGFYKKTFLLNFFSDILALMPPPVNALLESSPGGLRVITPAFWIKILILYKEIRIEIKIFLITCWRFQECLDNDCEYVETVWNCYYLECSEYWPLLYCYTLKISADKSFSLLQLFHAELGSRPRISNWTIWTIGIDCTNSVNHDQVGM